MVNEKPDGYGVWDTQENRWFTRGYKRVWCSKSAAGNAWNAQWRYDQRQLYSEQTRFVTKGIRFVAMD